MQVIKSPQAPVKTALYQTHVDTGAKMVEFAGFVMPVQYHGIINEHHAVRNSVGIFDVSHMGEFELRGKGALDFLQRMVTNDVSLLQAGQAQYTAMCYPDGGIIDDLIIYCFPAHYMIVVNAANIEKDFQWLQEQQGHSDVELVDVSSKTGLLAIQGRYAQRIIQKLVDTDLNKIEYYRFVETDICGTRAVISRTGYTGDDGFEVYIPEKYSVNLWNRLLEAGREFDIEPIGLGARDTLRLEVGFCLYGNDINQNTNPIEAGLGWVTKPEKKDFIGKEAILKMKKDSPARKLVGFEIAGRQIARDGYAILKDEKPIGQVTSGSFSPTLKKSIGMGYVSTENSAVGTDITIDIRGRAIAARVVKKPFYKRPY